VVPAGEMILEEGALELGTKSYVDSISKSCRAASWKSIPYCAKWVLIDSGGDGGVNNTVVNLDVNIVKNKRG
jgi:hypothetical protein